VTTYKPPRLTLPVGDRDHSEGRSDAPLVLVEYGDYQCPYCGAAYPIVKRIRKELGSSLRFVFRNFPITNSHPQAEWAAETAEAAAAQGKFWEMHDFLYENQRFLGDAAYFAKYEEKLKLDATRIAAEVAKGAYSSRIEEDFMSGVRSGVNGTPTFFINGVRYDGYPGFEQMVTALKAAQNASSRKKADRREEQVIESH
jgi:protein-disulfide isomerase